MNKHNLKIIIFLVALAAGIYVLSPWKKSKEVALGTPSTEDVVTPRRHRRAPASAEPLAAPASVRPQSEDKKKLINSIDKTQKCFATEDCNFPKSDPREYDYAVGQQLRALLAEYHEKFARDPQNQKETQTLALQFISSNDAFVQEQAMNLLNDLPPSEQNLKALTDLVSSTPDPSLVDQAMNEMKRYLGSDEESLVHQALRELFAHGPVFASQKAAKGVLPFINSSSYSGYDQTFHSLPQQSSVAQDLKTALDEYQRQQTGG